MKFRSDFVTNSSSSSFIIVNYTDKPMTSCQFAAKMFENGNDIEDFGYSADQVIASAADLFVLEPHSTQEIECDDHYENLFETYIHNELGEWDFNGYRKYLSDDIQVSFYESHH